MKNKFIGTMHILLLLNSCIKIKDTFRSTKLTSSKGENIYINTLNWGVTDDNQYTLISKDPNKLKERKDTIGGIPGLNPFIYQFKNDTLTIITQKDKTIKIEEEFKSIHLKYIKLENKDFTNFIIMANAGKCQYHQVPE